MTKTVNKLILILSFFYGLFFYNLSISQEIYLPDANIVPPPPTEVGLGKYGSIPVSKYTGVPDISIPIYELREGSLTLPITLSYHASGIRVDEMAGWVGLGWSLNAGGIITRTVVGMPDEQPNGYFESVLSLPNPNQNLDNFLNFNPTFNNLYKACTSKIDYEPDVYSFNFMGFSGKMYIDASFQCHITPHSDISISYDSANKKFIAKDYKGIVYEFNYTSASRYHQSSSVDGGSFSYGNDIAYTSTWYISRVYNPNTGDEITFHYKTVIENYDVHLTTEYGEVLCQWSTTDSRRYKVFSQNEVYSNSQFLDSIEGSDLFVKFKSSTLREDTKGLSGCKLDSIIIVNPNSHDIIHVFNYGYFSAGDGYYDKRLKLNSVEKKSSYLGLNGGSYIFDYYNGLPPRNSKQKDYWGYFNGEAMNDSKINGDIPTLIHHGTVYSGGILAPNAYAMKAGTLSKITYPTGGYTLFEYEPNYYSALYAQEMLAELNDSLISDLSRILPFNFSTTNEEYFEFSLFKDMPVTFNITKNNNELSAYVTDQYNSTPFEVCMSTSSEVKEMVRGNYRLHFEPRTTLPTIDNPFTAEGSIEYLILGKTPSIIQEMCGGLRIKKITNYESTNKESTSVRYNYTLEDKPTWSSGVRISSIPIFDYIRFRPSPTECGFYHQDVIYFRTNVNQANAILTKGSPVGYREVTEIYEDSSYTRSKYSMTHDEYFSIIKTRGTLTTQCAIEYPPKPFFNTPIDEKENLRGLLLSETYYNKNGMADRSTTYNYSPTNLRRIPGIRVGFEATTPSEIQGLDSSKHKIGYTTFVKSLYDTYLTSKEEITHDRLGVEIKKNTAYKYNSNKQVVDVTEKFKDKPLVTTNEQGKTPAIDCDKTICTTYSYAGDNFYNENAGITFDNNVHQEMLYRNMVSIPILSKTFINGNLVSGKASKYKFFQDKILPAEYYELNTDKQLFEKKKELNYNASGRVVEVKTSTGLVSSYYWSNLYKQYPVAKFDNIGYYSLTDEVKSKLDNMCFSVYMLKQNHDSIRLSLNPAALITTYSYTPGCGLTSQTDPNGLSTYYLYDGLERLIEIRDDDFNLMKKYDYHIAGQSSSDVFLICSIKFDEQHDGIITSTYTIRENLIDEPKIPTRVGFTFDGWYKEPGCLNIWNFDIDKVNSSTTLFAKWKVNTWTIEASIIGNGGTMNPIGNTTLNHGNSITYTFTPSIGYHIKSVKVDGTSLGSVSNYTFSNVVINHSLSVEFEVNSYLITFDSKGGSAVSPINTTFNTTITSPTPPTRTGYTFIGWYKESNGINEWNFSNDKITNNTTLYAKWNANTYTVTFDAQGGTLSVTQITAKYGSTLKSPIVSRLGYTFDGWYKNPSCTIPWESTDVIIGNITLYAKWISDLEL